jgi:hypothetical protein
MDEFEQRIRQVMLLHDRDVSGTVSLPPPLARRSPWLVPAVAAASIAVLTSVTVIALHSRGNPRSQVAGTTHAPATQAPVPPVQACPASIPSPLNNQAYVPAPATVPDIGKRLIPAQPPASALLCEYPTPVTTSPARIDLAASQRLTTGLAVLADQLSWLPPTDPAAVVACAEDPTIHPLSTYLLQLGYPGGTVWVSLPASRCGTSISNGSFRAVPSAEALSSAAIAFQTGDWPATAPEPDVCNGTEPAGRLGQESAMAPSGVTGMSICSANRSYPLTASSTYAPILHELNALQSQPSTRSCTGSGAGGYLVRLAYPAGPPVQITVTPGCQPSVDNGSLQARASTTLLSLLAAATR